MITLSVPRGGQLCIDRAHRNAGTLAQVIVTFGKLGVEPWQRESMGPQCWGRSYPMGGPCWDSTRRTAQKARPNLVIRHASRP